MIRGQAEIHGEPRSILLIQLGDIGDVVLTTPCFRAVRQAYPEAEITVAVWDRAAELLEECPFVDHVLVVGRERGLFKAISRQFDFLRRLRQSRFELAIDFRTGTRGAIMALLSGAGQRLGFNSTDGTWWRNRIFTGLLYRDYSPREHVVDYLLGLLNAFGIPSGDCKPELSVSDARRQETERLLESEGVVPDRLLVAVQPFSLWRYKEWGATKFVELINRLLSGPGAVVLVTGASGERERAERIARECGTGCHNLAGRTSIGGYAALLERCSLFIGMDSAGLHIAAAVGIPTVGIFGPSSPISWAPVGPEHRVVQKGLSCQPCRQKGCEGTEVSRCLDELTVDEVEKVIGEQLNDLR